MNRYCSDCGEMLFQCKICGQYWCPASDDGCCLEYYDEQ